MTDSHLFARIPFAVIDMAGLQDDGTKGYGHKALSLYTVMAKHADFETGDFYATRKTLAAEMGLKDAAAIDEASAALVDAGLLTVRPQWKDHGKPPNYSFTKDERFCVQTANHYTLHWTPHSTERPPKAEREPIPDWLDPNDDEAVLAWIDEMVGGLEDESTVLGILATGTYSPRFAVQVALESARKLKREGPRSLTTPRGSQRTHQGDDLGGW